MTYCSPLRAKMLSQIKYKQLDFDSDADYESFIREALIPAAEKIIDNYCKHDFDHNTDVTVTLDGNGKDTLLIPTPYVPAIADSLDSVEIDGVSVATSNFKLYDTKIVYDNGAFTKDPQNVVIVIDHGYTAVPDDVSIICADLSATMIKSMLFNRLIPDIINTIIERGGGDVTRLFAGMIRLTREQKDILNEYRFSGMMSG